MHPALWGSQLGNSWRTTNDINDSWERYCNPHYQTKLLKVGVCSSIMIWIGSYFLVAVWCQGLIKTKCMHSMQGPEVGMVSAFSVISNSVKYYEYFFYFGIIRLLGS